MKEQFVTYEIAKRLKELGFNEPCLATYNERRDEVEFQMFTSYNMAGQNNAQPPKGFLNSVVHKKIICAPLWQQVEEWLREKHRIVVGAQLQGNSFKQSWIPYHIQNLNPNNTKHFNDRELYEQAREAATLAALELISK
jgi:hypothetical protein